MSAPHRGDPDYKRKEEAPSGHYKLGDLGRKTKAMAKSINPHAKALAAKKGEHDWTPRKRYGAAIPPGHANEKRKKQMSKEKPY